MAFKAKQVHRDIIARIEALPDPLERLDQIGECYSRGECVLDAMSASDVAELLEVDAEGFDEPEWDFSAEVNSLPDRASLEKEMAVDVVSLIAESEGIEASRLEQLEALAEDLMENSSSTGSVLTQLGLTDDEVALAIEGWRNNILEGDAGWSHVAKLRKVARNGWALLFKVTYDDCDREISVTACAPDSKSEDAVDEAEKCRKPRAANHSEND